MRIEIKRAYAEPDKEDGYRVLVDRLWPRGLRKDWVMLDEWLKEIAPSDDLRRWFGHDAERWGEFRRRYLAELKGHRESLRGLVEKARKKRVTLIYGARDEERNNAMVLKQYLKMLGR